MYSATGPDGERVLSAPVRVRLDRDEDAPADGFFGVFPLPSRCGELTGLTVRDGRGKIWFDGIIDELERNESGGLLTVSARSRAALLLDNEARPQNYENPSLSTIFERHIRPYGFSGFLGNGRAFSGTLAVTKGMSEWSAAAAFCAAFPGTSPRVSGGVFDASGAVPEREVRFGPGGIPFSSAVLRSSYCSLLSELSVLSGDGGSYASAASDPGAVTLGIRRKRFLSGGASGAEKAMRRARRDSFAAVLDCPGDVWAPLLSPADVPGLRLPDGPLYLSAARYVLDADGEHTGFTLRRR